jgi:hypothetical protein
MNRFHAQMKSKKSSVGSTKCDNKINLRHLHQSLVSRTKKVNENARENEEENVASFHFVHANFIDVKIDDATMSLVVNNEETQFYCARDAMTADRLMIIEINLLRNKLPRQIVSTK